MRNYEVTFIIDPVLSSEEIKSTAQTYVKHIENEGATITHVNEMGLRQLAYEINKRTTGIYYCVEFQVANGALINPMELAFRRDERIMRFLTVSLEKYGVKYNADKRAGKIGTAKKAKKKDAKADVKVAPRGGSKSAPRKEKPAPVAAKTEAPKVEAKAEAPVAATPKVEAPVTPKVEAPVAAAPKVEAKVETPVAAPAPTAKPDDLKKIEGIGPKIAEILNNAGITTFAALATTDANKVKELLAAAGNRYKMHNPATWGLQSQMAADGKWDELKKWQDESDGGKPIDSSGEEE